MKEAFEVWDVTNIKEIYLTRYNSEQEALNWMENYAENGIYTIRKVYIKKD